MYRALYHLLLLNILYFDHHFSSRSAALEPIIALCAQSESAWEFRILLVIISF